MSHHSYLVLCAVITAVSGGSALAAEQKPEALAMTMSASMAPAETDVVVRLRVEPDARSREVTIEWVGDDLSGGAHAITLEGARAAARHQYAIKRMTPGQYVVTAILRQNDGREIRRTAKVTIVGIGGPEMSGRGAARRSP